MKLSRRTFLTCAAVAGGPDLMLSAYGQVAATVEREPAIVEAWMNEWMAREKDVSGTLHLSRFADPVYFLLKPITWKPNPEQLSFNPVTVPIGFITDFASIPRAFWSVFRPDGRYTYPAIVHDYLYWTQTTTKEVADLIFKFGMEDFGVGSATITTLYKSVELAGGSAWRENARLSSSGEKRILKIIPSDPRILWEDWKKDPEHFASAGNLLESRFS